MSIDTDDVGARRSLTPTEAFAAITYDRVLIIDETRIRTYIKRSGRDEYLWFAVNEHGATCGGWFRDRQKSRRTVRLMLESEYCQNQTHEQLSSLKKRVQQGLKDVEKKHQNP